MSKPTLLVFGGAKADSGAGPANLIQHTLLKGGDLDARVVGLVATKKTSGIKELAERYGIPFFLMEAELTAERYQNIARRSGAEWFASSGWTRYMCGLPPERTFNIHPGLLVGRDALFCGPGMYGDRVHAAVADAIAERRIKRFGMGMHFVTEAEGNANPFDTGPVFFQAEVEATPDMGFEHVRSIVRMLEHRHQPRITNLVLHGEIRWDGKDPKSLVVPAGLWHAG